MTDDITGEWIIDDVIKQWRGTLRIFTKYGIDACCGSQDSIATEATKRKVDQDIVLKELNTFVQEQGA
jgi:regulator of cell morphogenesis and NO signaling